MPKRKRFTPAKAKEPDDSPIDSFSDNSDSEEENSIDLNHGNYIGSDDEKEEVLPVVDDSEDEENGDYDYEESEEGSAEDDAENVDAWGKKKSTFYSTDFVDEDRGRSYRDEDREAAKAEEMDALEIQRRFLDKIHSSVFDSASFMTDEPVDDENKVAVAVTDWSSISKKKKIKMVKKESPELIPLLQEFKKTVGELKEMLPRYIELSESKQQAEGMDYVKLKLQLMLQYAMNCSMYVVMKAKKQTLTNHPILEQINQFHVMLESMKNFEGEKSRKTKARKNRHVSFAPQERGKKTDKLDSEAERINGSHIDDEEESAEPTQEKRSVSYQIAKNKGLTPQRKKEYRNPRVRHRMKFKRALVKRKGQVRTPRTEIQRYGGEISGIQPNVTKSIKFK